ncbi:MAG TPA: histidine kinase [Candidatus Polarisedimenticolia bacterium]|nr:histidine kinase [Candidatus Polarisedimenticolia bacterium]
MRHELEGFLRQRGDGALAAVLTTIVLIEVVLTPAPEYQRLATTALAFALGVTAARRSRDPLPLLGLMLAVAAAALAVPWLRGPTNSGVFAFLLLAVYSASAHTSGRRTLLAGAMTLGIYALVFVSSETGITADAVVFFSLIMGAPWIAGRAVRQRRLNDRELEQEKTRAAAAIVEERARIARELHDVVAHSISVMVIQARGGRHVLDSEPADARDAFEVIEWTGQQALDEMRRLVGMLRSGDESLPLAPQPSLRELGTLVDQVQAAGLPVQLTVEGEPRDLPPGVDLSAFRIVQEALTNALTHAGPAHARVVLRYAADELEVEISDDGPGTGGGTGSGYGLVGMRERVSVYGGELQAGRRPEGGYTLRVRLPLRTARA